MESIGAVVIKKFLSFISCNPSFIVIRMKSEICLTHSRCHHLLFAENIFYSTWNAYLVVLSPTQCRNLDQHHLTIPFKGKYHIFKVHWFIYISILYQIAKIIILKSALLISWLLVSKQKRIHEKISFWILLNLLKIQRRRTRSYIRLVNILEPYTNTDSAMEQEFADCHAL